MSREYEMLAQTAKKLKSQIRDADYNEFVLTNGRYLSVLSKQFRMAKKLGLNSKEIDDIRKELQVTLSKQRQAVGELSKILQRESSELAANGIIGKIGTDLSKIFAAVKTKKQQNVNSVKR